MYSRCIHFLVIAAMAFVLSGCGAATGWVIAGGAAATAGSLMTAKKLPNDIIAERQTGLECDTIRGLETNTEICRPKYEDRIRKQEAGYCYRSIGSISCYRDPNPNYVEVAPRQERK